MVEAAVVVTVLAVFLGVIAFVHRSYARRLEDQALTRFEALSFASHDCSASAQPPSGSRSAGVPRPSDVVAEGAARDDVPRSLALGQSGATERAEITGALERDGSIAHSERVSAVSARATAPSTRGPSILERHIRSESHVLCNQKARTADPMALVELAMEAAERAPRGGLP